MNKAPVLQTQGAEGPPGFPGMPGDPGQKGEKVAPLHCQNCMDDTVNMDKVQYVV